MPFGTSYGNHDGGAAVDAVTRKGPDMKPNPLLSVLVVGAALATNSADAAIVLEEGKPFPELLLPSIEDGRPTSVARFRGKPLILQVFASW